MPQSNLFKKDEKFEPIDFATTLNQDKSNLASLNFTKNRKCIRSKNGLHFGPFVKVDLSFADIVRKPKTKVIFEYNTPTKSENVFDTQFQRSTLFKSQVFFFVNDLY